MNFITGRLLASADIIDIVLAIIQVSFIVLFVYLIKCVYFSRKKDVFTLVNGWYSVDWKSIKKSKKILKALDSLKLEHSNLWSIGFKIDYFSKIHYRSNYTLLSICKDLHVNNKLDSKKKDDIKRIITASGILFNFKIPKALFIMDQETITIALKYTVLSEKLIINFNNFN